MDCDYALDRLELLMDEAQLHIKSIQDRVEINLTPTLPLQLWQQTGTKPIDKDCILDPEAGDLEWRLHDGRVWKAAQKLDFAGATASSRPVRRMRQGKKNKYYLDYNILAEERTIRAFAPTTAIDVTRVDVGYASTGDFSAMRVQLGYKKMVRGMVENIESLRVGTETLKRRREEVEAFEAKLAALPAAKKPRTE